MAAPHPTNAPSRRPLCLAAVNVSSAGGEASSDSDFRARGLKARSELTMVIGASVEPLNLAPVFIGGEAVAGDKLKLQKAGISHVCAYMVGSGSSLREALERVSAARPAAQPNSAFMQQLIAYEEATKGMASLRLHEYLAAIRERSTSSASILELISPTDSANRKGRAERRVVLDGHQMLVKCLGTAPRMAMIENFLTCKEADAAIAAAVDSGRLHRSLTAPKDGDKSNAHTEPGMPSLVSEGRTSSNCRLDRTHPVGAAALRRAAHLTGLTPQHAEALQVVHYDRSQRYNAHYDYFQEGRVGYEKRMGTQGQRMVTCFVYLNNVDGGGCTYFPELKMRFKPRKGCALLWYNTERDGSLDPKTLHAGEPVTSGEKWGMNIWLRQRSRQPQAR